MTRDEKIATAERLSREGYNNRQIAEDLGVTPPTVWKWLHPERAAEINRASNATRNDAKRAWDRSMRATCSHCGGPMQAGSLKADGSTRKVKGDRCAACATTERADLVIEMWDLRRNEGLLNTEIAARLEVAVGTVATELYRLRALGYDVPMSPYNQMNQLPVRATALDKSARALCRELEARGIHPTGRAA